MKLNTEADVDADVGYVKNNEVLLDRPSVDEVLGQFGVKAPDAREMSDHMHRNPYFKSGGRKLRCVYPPANGSRCEEMVMPCDPGYNNKICNQCLSNVIANATVRTHHGTNKFGYPGGIIARFVRNGKMKNGVAADQGADGDGSIMVNNGVNLHLSGGVSVHLPQGSFSFMRVIRQENPDSDKKNNRLIIIIEATIDELIDYDLHGDLWLMFGGVYACRNIVLGRVCMSMGDIVNKDPSILWKTTMADKIGSRGSQVWSLPRMDARESEHGKYPVRTSVFCAQCCAPRRGREGYEGGTYDYDSIVAASATAYDHGLKEAAALKAREIADLKKQIEQLQQRSVVDVNC